MGFKQSSRRTFIRNTAIAATGFFIVPRHVLGRGFIAPSDKLNVAGIGVGGKGASDLAEIAKSPYVNIVALCDVDEREAARSVKAFAGRPYYKDYRVMLEKENKNIDACTISTPDHVHAVATLAAMQLGKHVYTQKPLTHDIFEARTLTEAAKKYKVVTQMGNQGASGNGVRQGQEMVRAGMIGDVKEIMAWTNRPVWPQGLPLPAPQAEIPKELDWDLWLGPVKHQPYTNAYVPFNWRGWWAFGTGALGDMACHILDPAFRILPIKYPESAECSITSRYVQMWKETVYPESCPPSSIIHLVYPRTDGKGKIKLSWYDGGLLPLRPEELLPDEPLGEGGNGILFIGTKGKLLFDCYGANPRLLPTKLMKEKKMPAQSIKRVTEGHYLQWVNACIAGYGNAQVSSPFEYAGPLTESILMGNLAIRSAMIAAKHKDGYDIYPGRKKLMWDAENMKVTNYDEANQFVRTPYRDGYSLTV